MDPVTLIGLVAVAVMFSAGVGLVFVGLRRRPDRLPAHADAVLAAVADGRLSHDGTIDLVHPPAEPPRASQPTPAVRLLRKAPAPAPTTSVPAPAPSPAMAGTATAVEGRGDDPFTEALFDGVADSTDASSGRLRRRQLQRS